jgi:hypothetical protein
MGEKPRAEPEIIPPIHDDRQSRSGRRASVCSPTAISIRHVYIARLEPSGVLIIALMIGILFTVILVLFVGALLIWIPLVGLLVAAAITSSVLRGHFRR